jgi:chromatin assembly factor 1 subunit A
LAIRDILSQLSEAEIAGDISVVRSLLSKLHDRTLLPAKVIIFADDARPGYFGTWTRSSRIIGPRSPFARDILVFDYGYDSGEEWEEEAAGEADDVVDDGEEEDADAEDPDSDLDSWLVDDDDVQEPGTPLGERAASPSLPDFPVPASALKRKAEEGERKLAKKRKVVVPLMPFAKGPCWESTVGRCEYDTFKPYRIQLFNGKEWLSFVIYSLL